MVLRAKCSEEIQQLAHDFKHRRPFFLSKKGALSNRIRFYPKSWRFTENRQKNVLSWEKTWPKPCEGVGLVWSWGHIWTQHAWQLLYQPFVWQHWRIFLYFFAYFSDQYKSAGTLILEHGKQYITPRIRRKCKMETLSSNAWTLFKGARLTYVIDHCLI